MQYEGPQDTDLENVRALNEAFLELLRCSSGARQYLIGLPEDLATRLTSLTPRQAARLAEVPFLLFSFRERDDRLWRVAFEHDPGQDLFAAPRSAAADADRFVAAALGFVWQLARKNPYALRLLCGATVHWCEQLGDHTLIHILNFATSNQELLVLRMEFKAEIWTKLLYSGVHQHLEVRRAAQLSVLQTLLTQVDRSSAVRWASAACRLTAPTLKVAEKRDN